ncbi:MAG: PHP domain-containing protein [Rhodothermales bacterium]
MPNLRADLHLHSTASDGLLSPTQLVEQVREAGLSMMALTDHDTIAGIAEAASACEEAGITFVPGTELSVGVGKVEVHMLAYGFDPLDGMLCAMLDAFERRRVGRAEAMVEKLNDLGVALTMDDVRAEAEGDIIARPHLAQALVTAGHSTSVRHAFDQYLKNRGPAYVRKPTLDARRAIEVVHAAGGVTVLAHPGHWMSDRTIHTLFHGGLDGIEVIHPVHDANLQDFYRRTAQDYSLLPSGGSDFHGRPGDEANLGRYSIPIAWAERLLQHLPTP